MFTGNIPRASIVLAVSISQFSCALSLDSLLHQKKPSLLKSILSAPGSNPPPIISPANLNGLLPKALNHKVTPPTINILCRKGVDFSCPFFHLPENNHLHNFRTPNHTPHAIKSEVQVFFVESAICGKISKTFLTLHLIPPFLKVSRIHIPP